VEVAVTGVDTLDDLARALDSPAREDPATAAIARFAEAFVQAAQYFSPFRTGRLERGISARVAPDGVLIEAAAPYAVYVLGGVRPGYMTGLIGHTVSFVARDGARVVRRVTRVGEWGGRRHWYSPGQPADDFFRKAWEDRVVQGYRAELAAAGVTLTIAFLYDAPAA